MPHNSQIIHIKLNIRSNWISCYYLQFAYKLIYLLDSNVKFLYCLIFVPYINILKVLIISILIIEM